MILGFSTLEGRDRRDDDPRRHGRFGTSRSPAARFPETHLMWRAVAPLLATEFAVVGADLRGYGRSGCPPSDARHIAYSKRTMARDMVAVTAALGFDRFSIVGHDRGGRVAYRLAPDHPERVHRLGVLTSSRATAYGSGPTIASHSLLAMVTGGAARTLAGTHPVGIGGRDRRRRADELGVRWLRVFRPRSAPPTRRS
jgi:pimeloyl-ACP methyl ester carboxylesterase